MIYDKGFLKKASKVVSIYDRLGQLYSRKVLGEKEYLEKKSKLFERIRKLKMWNLSLLNNELKVIQSGQAELDHKYEKGILDKERHGNVYGKLVVQRKEIESELDMLDLLSGEEYVSYLRKLIEEVEVDRSYGWKTGIEVLRDALKPTPDVTDEIPKWAWLVFAAVVVAYTGLGYLGETQASLLILPFYAVLSILLGTLLLHVSTYVLGFETSSVKRAFTCLMMNVPLSFLARVFFGLLFSMMLGMSLKSMLARGATQADLYSLFGFSVSLIVVLFAILFAIFVFCIKVVYASSTFHALGAAFLNIILWVFLMLALLFFQLPFTGLEFLLNL